MGVQSKWPAIDRALAWAVAWVLRRSDAETLLKAENRARLAGWQSPAAGGRLLAAGFILPLLLPILGVPIILLRGDEMMQAASILLMLGIAGQLGPKLFAANMGERRRQTITNALPDAIDLLVICAGAGLSLDVALARTARELAPAQPALAAELGLTSTELGFLPHRADAFANLARRLPLPQIQALADMFVQTERFGTPLAQTLRIMAAEYRSARLLRAEEKAGRLPALMTVPMIAFILPPLFIVLIGPAVITTLS
jgi:tight adherence protein C